MTAEIVVINKSAVALAADSAVTITSGGQEKIYNSVNKIFELSDNTPIAVMVYGNLTFMSAPLEGLVKEFREQNSAKTFTTLEECANAFFHAIVGDQTITEKEKSSHVLSILYSYYGNVRGKIWKWMNEEIQAGRSISNPNMNKGALAILSEMTSKLQSKPRNAVAAGVPDKTIATLYTRELEQAYKATTRLFRPNAQVKKAFQKLGCAFLTSDEMSEGRTGIVFVGYGKNDKFPEVAAYEVDGMVNSKIKKVKVDEYSIKLTRGGLDEASIIPFAQKEMVDRFMYGVDPDYDDYAQGKAIEILKGGVGSVLNHLPNLSAADKASALDMLNKQLVPQTETSLKDQAKKYQEKQFKKKVVDMVTFMPKQELAHLAESLVNITSIKRKVSAERETVGGPIDVAVLSRDDGFVWVKRKHYFDQDLNPRYMLRLGRRVGRVAQQN